MFHIIICKRYKKIVKINECKVFFGDYRYKKLLLEPLFCQKCGYHMKIIAIR